MNKKAYVTPDMREITINVPQILSGSDTVTVKGSRDAEIEWGGFDSDQTPI